MTHTIRTFSRLRAGFVALATTAGVLFAGGVATGSSVSAAAPMAVNAVAPFVTQTAEEAVASLDLYVETNDAATYRKFFLARAQTAELAADQLGYPQDEMIAAWTSAPLDHQRAVLAAMTQVGVPYRTNTSKPGVGFDCSGLTTYAWSQAGVSLPRQSTAQIRAAGRVDRSTAIAGDLVQYPGHVMLYLGVGDAIIHSITHGRTVEIDTISGRRTGSVRFGDPTL